MSNSVIYLIKANFPPVTAKMLCANFLETISSDVQLSSCNIGPTILLISSLTSDWILLKTLLAAVETLIL